VVTVIEARGSTPRGVGAKAVIFADGRIVGTVGGGDVEARAVEEAMGAMAEGSPREVIHQPGDVAQESMCGEGMRLLIEPLPARPILVIVGAGHVGQAVAELGAFLGYRVRVVDERPDLLTPDRLPDAEALPAGDLAEGVGALPLDENTYVVIVTPHQTADERVLAVLSQRPVPYVGLMGSRRRTADTFEKARQMGVPDRFLMRIHTPIGLDIDAETPREIAVSILAEITAVRRGRD
jgi:xanthine dehydrogenase accessory factor